MSRRSSVVLTCFIAALALSSLSSCATYQTISAAKPGSPKVYSGTRLDLYTLGGKKRRVARFKVDPPQHPLIDLPFSIVLDTLILPLSTSVALYEVIFE